MALTPKDAMQNSHSARAEYSFHRDPKVTRVNNPSVAGPERMKQKRHLGDNITQVFTKEELAKVRSLPHIEVTDDGGTTFNLTSKEVEFIQAMANEWGMPYENAVAKVIHDSLECMRDMLERTRRYKENK